MGVRHNDLRTPNILIKESGEVTIIDFDQADLTSTLRLPLGLDNGS